MDVTSSSSIGIVHDSSGVKIGSIRDDAFVARHWNLSSPISYLADTACLSKEAYLYVKGMFAEIHQKVREINSNDGIVARDHNKEGKMACDEVQCTRGDKNESPTDPTSDSDTSDTSTSDDEGSQETSLMLQQSKPRLCNGCNRRGVSHDKRNCPALLKRCTREDKNESPTDTSSDSDTSDTSTSDDERTSLMLPQSKPRLCNGYAQEKIRMNLQLMQLLKPKADTFDISTSDDEGPQGDLKYLPCPPLSSGSKCFESTMIWFR
ncbi:hypothetical protein MRB53_007929 [Persea americana]|uniref:Uncharacterized protein n=1 Tax=Persea americana TaxID=3435 RepID=A0ACC2MK87_PERAE|nr:hypothetical protein MRB53_007929 [Persea americana]